MKTVPVSVIIPCFNCASVIERAVSSVFGQTARPAELFLVDDASTDRGETAKKLAELKERYGHSMEIEVITFKKNRGPSAARNAGWAVAMQPYIAFLDADDAWHTRKIEIQYHWMETHPDVAMTGHPCSLWRRKEEATVSLPQVWNAHEVSRILLLFSNRFNTPSVMLRRDIPFRFKQGMHYCEDYLLWLQIVFSGSRAWRIELPLAFLFKPVFGKGGLSRNLWQLSKGEMTAIRLIRTEKLIGAPAWLFITVYVFLKYLRRLGISILSGRLLSNKTD